MRTESVSCLYSLSGQPREIPAATGRPEVRCLLAGDQPLVVRKVN